MKNHRIIFYSLSMSLFMLVLMNFSNKIFAQVNENNEAVNATIVDSLSDDDENLLDSNANYQRLYDNLNSSGDWIQVTKSALVEDLADQTSDDISYSEDPLDSADANQVIYVWRPTIVGSYWDWNPYCDGRWVFTYSGWVWVSDYEWGWAPYHYGRWCYSGYYGWIWFPGRVWAPNWVWWRYNHNYCGWYPRGPHIWWRGRHGHIHHNYTIKSNPKHWIFANTKNLTSNINKKTIIDNSRNKEILKNTGNLKAINTCNTKNANIKYKGPDITSLMKTTGEKIVPKQINPTTKTVKSEITSNGVTVYRNDDIGKKDLKDKNSDENNILNNNNSISKPNANINGNELNTKNNEKSVNSAKKNESTRTPAKNVKQEVAVNSNVKQNSNKKSVKLYSNNEFYKVQEKMGVKPSSSRNNSNSVNKSGNNNTNKSRNNEYKNQVKQPSNNTDKTRTKQDNVRPNNNSSNKNYNSEQHSSRNNNSSNKNYNSEQHNSRNNNSNTYRQNNSNSHNSNNSSRNNNSTTRSSNSNSNSNSRGNSKR
jgi:hypothetical protein